MTAGRGERPTVSEISVKGVPKTSCRTKATRSAGVTESRTTSMPMLTDSSSVIRSAGSSPPVPLVRPAPAALVQVVPPLTGSGSHSPV